MKLLIFLATALLFGPWTWAQGLKDPQATLQGKAPFKVAILPVTMHSPENLGYMQEGMLDMLSSRVELEGRVSVLEKGAVKKALGQISEEIDTEKARKLGQSLEVDYVVYGSLTKLGDSASLDLKVLEVAGEKASSSVFVQARKMEEIILRVDDLARKIDEKILGYPLSPPVTEKPAGAERSAEAPRSMAAIPVPPATAPAPPPGFRPMAPAKAERGAIAGGLWQSTPFPFKIKGMAMGDLDGDGRNEIVLIDERNLWIYRYENEFKLLKKIPGKQMDQYLAVDVGDINKDGKAEIFVTNLTGDEAAWSRRQLSSFVVAHKDGDYRVVASNLDWYLRVVGWGERGAVLLGQKKGVQTGFEGQIFELGWDGKTYEEIRKAEVSKVPSLYGFTPFTHGGKTLYAFVDSDFRLKVLDQKGKITWRSNSFYGSNNTFQLKPPDTLASDIKDEWAVVNVRVIARGDELLVLRNFSSSAGDLFKRQSFSGGGEVQSLVWNGAMFMEAWRSPEIPGYLADFQTQNLFGAAGSELVVAVNLAKESMFSGQAGSALMMARIQ